MAQIGAYEARTHLAELLDRVERGERIVITRHGVPVAVLQPPEPGPRLAVAEAVTALRGFRAGRRAGGDEIRQWISEGRD